ncbi:MAG: 30S ribosomal protein S3 [Chloroflexi bacterium]|nr:30S ribosomal protein S3 [Chloroflexota bacterium]
MGHKVHPTGFRLGVIRDWQSRWYADDKSYAEFLSEDLKIRHGIQSGYGDAGISRVEIERQANKVTVTIHTARPGVVIGRGGQRVDEMRNHLEGLIGKRIQLNIVEIQQPELDAYLVARTVAQQLEQRIAYRRAIKQAIFRTRQAGAKGIKVRCSGRLGGAEIARRQTIHDGQLPLQTLRADIDFGMTEARTPLGRIGVEVWIYKGDILPEAKTPEGAPAEVAAAEPGEAAPATETERTAVQAAATQITEEKPAQPEAAQVTEKKPSTPARRRTKPAKATEPEAAQVTEKKPSAPARRRTKPAKATEPEAAQLTEKKPSAPAKRRTKPAKATEPEAAQLTERKPSAPAKRRTKPAKATEPAPPTSAEERDATTEAS